MNFSRQPSSSHRRAAARISSKFAARLTLGLGLAALSFAPWTARAADDAFSSAPTNANFTGNFTLGTQTPGAAQGSPTAGDSLYFGTSIQTTLNDDLAANFSIGGLFFNAGASAFTISGNAFTLANGGSLANNSTSTQTMSNGIVFSGATAANITTVANANLILNSKLNGSSTPVNISGAGTVTFGGAAGTLGANATGLVTVSGGTLILGRTGTTQSTSTNNIGVNGLLISGGTVQIANSAGQINTGATVTINSGTFDLNGLSEVLGGLAGTGGVVSNNSTTAAATVSILGSSGSISYGGVLQNGTGGRTLGLSKTNGNVQTLTGTNTYTGTTSVTGGALFINGNQSAATGNVTVGASGTLGGIGNIGGATTVTGMLSVGGSSGTGSTTGALTFSNTGAALTLNGAAFFDINGNSGKGVANGNDLVNLTAGNLVYGGTLNVSLNGFTPTVGSTYDLFDFTGTQTGTFSSIIVGDGSSFNNTFNYATGVLTLTAVPEPSTWVAGALCLAAVGWISRSRRRAGRA